MRHSVVSTLEKKLWVKLPARIEFVYFYFAIMPTPTTHCNHTIIPTKLQS